MTDRRAVETSGPDEPADPTAPPPTDVPGGQVGDAPEHLMDGGLAGAMPSAEAAEKTAGVPPETATTEDVADAPPDAEPAEEALGTIAEAQPSRESAAAMAEAEPGREPAAAMAEAEPGPVDAGGEPTTDAASAPPTVGADPSAEDNLRVAHILLRMGSPLPARAHLETLAGANRLDRQGLLDLAESRWRTGDLPGAGEATVAYFEHGGSAALAYLIAAEATAATGRPSEAARFARRALDGLTLPLDAVFAGQPRSPIWPNDPADPGVQAGTLFAEPANDPTRGGRIGLTGTSRPLVEAWPGRARAAGGVGVMAEPRGSDASNEPREGTPHRSLWDEPEPAGEPGAIAASAHVSTEATDQPPPPEASPDQPSVDRDGLDPALPDVGIELDGARDDLAAGDNRAAAVRLAVVLRLRPALAPAVLDVIGDLPGPDFDLLRGDALRLVGHEAAAQRAFAAAASALPEPSDPGRDE